MEVEPHLQISTYSGNPVARFRPSARPRRITFNKVSCRRLEEHSNYRQAEGMNIEKIEPREPWLVAVFTCLGLAGYSVVSHLPEFLNISSRAVTVPLRALILGLALIVMLMAAQGRLDYRLGHFAIPLLVFWGLYLLRMLADGYLNPVRLRLPPAEYLLYGLGTSLLPMLAFGVLQDRRTIAKSIRLTLAVLAFGCLIGILNNLSELRTGARFDGNEIFNTISFGHLGTSVAGVSILLLVQGNRPYPLPRWALIAFIPLGLLTLLVAGSRGPLVALAAMLLAIALAGFKRGRGIQVLVLLFALVSTVPRMMNEPTSVGGTLVERLANVTTDQSTSIRKELWRHSWEQFLDNPILGSSLEERYELIYPHNLVLEAFMSTGLLGGIAFLILLLGGLFRAKQLILSRSHYGWLGLLFVQYSVGGMFSGSLYGSSTFWYLLAAVGASKYAEDASGLRSRAQINRQIHLGAFDALPLISSSPD